MGCPRCVRRWLVRPIRARNDLPHVGQTCMGTSVAAFAALALRSARFSCAVVVLLASYVWQPWWISMRHVDQSCARVSQEVVSISRDLREAYLCITSFVPRVIAFLVKAHHRRTVWVCGGLASLKHGLPTVSGLSSAGCELMAGLLWGGLLCLATCPET